MFKNKFYKLTMQDETNMLDFLFTIKDLLVQIVGVRDVIKDENVVLTVLNVLPKSYKSFVQGMSIPETLPNFDQLTSKLFQEAQQKKLHDDHTKTKEALLLKFKQLFKKKKTNNELP